MSANTTLPGVLLTGTHAGRPAANTVANGTLYAETDTGQAYQSNGSAWSAWGAVSGGMTNPMTTVGDSIVGGTVTGGVAAPTRVAAGTSGYVWTANGAGVAPTWQAAAAGGGGALGALSFSSGADTTWKSTSSATVADIDAVNAAMSVTVPASGNILVMIQCDLYTSVAHSLCSLGVRTGSTTLAMRPVMQTGWQSAPAPGGANDMAMWSAWFLITGQTPGALTIKAAFAVVSGGGTLNILAYDGLSGHNAPFVMVAWAA